jgi:predicted kinase
MYRLRYGASIAPVCAGVLQARYMRKWINERLKRRKKTGDKPSKEATKAPEPLQPRFYDDDPAAPPAPVSAEAEVVEAPDLQAELPPESDSAAAETAPADGKRRPAAPRRRRSRGRRGGARQRPMAAAAAGPSSEASSPLSGEEAVAAPSPAEAVDAEGLPVQSAPVSAPVQKAHEAPAPARASKGTVVLAIGLPGSGKSSWFKRHNIHPLSSDLLRELLFDDAQEQRFQDLVFSNLRSMLKARLIARRPMNYVDATNLTPHDRHSWIKLAKDYGYDVQGLFFDVPLEVCMERHQRRGRAVAEDVMRKMAGKLKAPTFEEGFSKITMVRVKQKDGASPVSTE